MGQNKILIRVLAAGAMGSLVFIGGCMPAGEEGGFGWTPFLFLAAIFAVFYFVLIRPQRKRQQEHQHFIEELKARDKIITAGGIHGQIESVSEDSIVIKIESGATMRVARRSIVSKQTD